MKFKLIALFFIATVHLSCSSEDEKSTNFIEIYNDGTTKIELLQIEDERCPSDVACVWEGNAEVFLRITEANTSIDYSLHTAGINNPNRQPTYPNSTVLFNKSIILLDVQPLPLHGITYPVTAYTVSLDVQ